MAISAGKKTSKEPKLKVIKYLNHASVTHLIAALSLLAISFSIESMLSSNEASDDPVRDLMRLANETRSLWVSSECRFLVDDFSSKS